MESIQYFSDIATPDGHVASVAKIWKHHLKLKKKKNENWKTQRETLVEKAAFLLTVCEGTLCTESVMLASAMPQNTLADGQQSLDMKQDQMLSY